MSPTEPPEPDDRSYQILKAEMGTLLWKAAREKYEELEKAGRLEAELRRRTMPVWDRLQTLAEQGVPYVQAMEEVAPLMYPPEGKAKLARQEQKSDRWP